MTDDDSTGVTDACPHCGGSIEDSPVGPVCGECDRVLGGGHTRGQPSDVDDVDDGGGGGVG